MEKLIISVEQESFDVRSNLEAAPLVVQLVQEGKQWRLKLAAPVVGLAGNSLISARYADYYQGYLGTGRTGRKFREDGFENEVPRWRWENRDYSFSEHFEHQSNTNRHFALTGKSGLMKDLNLLQLRLQKQPAMYAEELQKLLAKQLRKVYWDGFGLGLSPIFYIRDRRSKKWLKKLGNNWQSAPAFQNSLEQQREKLALRGPDKRDYRSLLRELYRFPPMHYAYETGYRGIGNKPWPYQWGSEALGVLGVNRQYQYCTIDKIWYDIESPIKVRTMEHTYPPFYRRNYQRYKENGAICSGYPDNFFCRTDARYEWRKAVDWFPDSVTRKDNGPLRKPPYLGHGEGSLPSKELGQEEFVVHRELLTQPAWMFEGMWDWSEEPEK